VVRNLSQELVDWQGWPEAWRPKPGEVLIGVIESYDIGHTPYGPVRTVIATEEKTGEKVSLWLSSTVLLEQFKRHQPKPGERFGLKYLGKDAEKGYHRYRLIIDRPAVVEDFSPLGGEEDDADADAPWNH
jgi:hypothetical protein